MNRVKDYLAALVACALVLAGAVSCVDPNQPPELGLAPTTATLRGVAVDDAARQIITGTVFTGGSQTITGTAQGLIADGVTLTGQFPILVGGMDALGRAQSILVDSTGAITVNQAGSGTTTVTGTVSVNNAASGPLKVQGEAASGAAPAGNPVAIGAGGGGGTTMVFWPKADQAATFGQGIVPVVGGLIGDGSSTWYRALMAVGTTSNGHAVTAVNTEGTKATYSAVITNVAPAAGATDWFTMTGSATKTVKVKRVVVAGFTTASVVNVLTRSTVDSGGTLQLTPTAAKFDSTNAASTVAALGTYSANPTLGTLAGVVATNWGSTLASGGGTWVREFGTANEQTLTLRGVAEMMAVDFAGGTPGNNMSVAVTWTEE